MTDHPAKGVPDAEPSMVEDLLDETRRPEEMTQGELPADDQPDPLDAEASE